MVRVEFEHVILACAIPTFLLALVALWSSYRRGITPTGAWIMIAFSALGASVIVPDLAPYALLFSLVWPTGVMCGLLVYLRSLRRGMQNGTMPARRMPRVRWLNWRRV